MKPTRYTDPNRLGDVMALIQMLALGSLANRSEAELNRRLQGKPTSRAATWAELAENHREFFRVVWLDKKPQEGVRPPETEQKEGNVALIWRDALPKVEGTDLPQRQRPPLSPESVVKLLEIAVSLHDREMTRNQRFAYLVPIGGAIIGGLFLILALLIQLYLKMPMP